MFLGTLSESLVSSYDGIVRPTRDSFQVGRPCCATQIYSSVARFKSVDTSEVAQAAL